GAEPGSDAMPVAAHTAGGHSTLDVLIGIAVLIWALAGAAALLGWLSRFARRDQMRPGSGPRNRGLLSRLRARVGPSNNTASAFEVAGNTIAPTTMERSTDPPSAASNADLPRQSLGDSRRAAKPIPPAIPGTRHSPETLEPLATYLDTARLLGIAEARVARTLAALPRERWLIERYVLVAGHRIPFVILGETGLFAVWALSGPPMWHELPFPSEMAAHVKGALPGYAGPVRVGICRALAASGIEPRWWCRPGQPGAWIMGLDWLIRWLEHFGPAHGLGVNDIEQLRALAKPQGDPVPPRAADVVPDIR
ncbi:MAG: hypothetical protein ACXVII_45930, partial [Solirubrobacteraceae bacterium]